MYSRRFYGGERTQRSRGVPTAVMSSEKTPPNSKNETKDKVYSKEASVTDTSPRRALDIACTEESDSYELEEYVNPKDFAPISEKKSVPDMVYEREIRAFCQSCAEKDDDISDDGYHDEIDDIDDITENNMSDDEKNEDVEIPKNNGELGIYENLFDSSISQMTLEDMMLAGILMLGSSGEYDDEIMLILGLILVIGS